MPRAWLGSCLGLQFLCANVVADRKPQKVKSTPAARGVLCASQILPRPPAMHDRRHRQLPRCGAATGFARSYGRKKITALTSPPRFQRSLRACPRLIDGVLGHTAKSDGRFDRGGLATVSTSGPPICCVVRLGAGLVTNLPESVGYPDHSICQIPYEQALSE